MGISVQAWVLTTSNLRDLTNGIEPGISEMLTIFDHEAQICPGVAGHGISVASSGIDRGCVSTAIMP